MAMDENQLALELEVDQHASRSLIDAARWARFIAIFIFAIMGFMILVLIFAGSKIGNRISDVFPIPEGFGLLVGIVIIVVVFCSVVFFLLLRGANLIKKGIEIKDQQML